MSDITLITPPDKIFNQSKSILLIYPSEESRQAVQSFLAQSDQHFNVYLNTEDKTLIGYSVYTNSVIVHF